ncbi:MAG: hypothetical protein WAK17_09185 [Candidatus Nitrosopolaris sp.]
MELAGGHSEVKLDSVGSIVANNLKGVVLFLVTMKSKPTLVLFVAQGATSYGMMGMM